MHKCLLLAFTTFVSTASLFQSLMAQNVSPYWSLAGNSNASNTTSKLGTTNAINLRLFTNNVERMRILSTNGNVGLGTINPTDRLHINTPSGTNVLRAQVNGNTKLLVASNGGVAVGANQTPPTNGLYVSGNVGIGTSAPAAGYKLHVVGKGQFSAGLDVYAGGIISSNRSGSHGVEGFGNLSSGMGVFGNGYYGVWGTGERFGLYGYTEAGYGVYGTGSSGVYGNGTDHGVFGISENYAVLGSSGNGTGVQGTSTNSFGGNFDSYYSTALRASTTFGTYAGAFYGSVYLSNGYTTSDKNLKRDVQAFDDAMNLINQLKPRYYAFKTDEKYAFLHLPKGNHYGLLAQDVEEVLPSLVSTANHQAVAPAKQPAAGSSGTRTSMPGATGQRLETISIKAVNYVELIPILVKGMQELDAKTQEIAELKARIEKLEMLLQGRDGRAITSASLSQNTPNPARASTRISYKLPAGAAKAQLQVFDNSGKLLKAVSLNTSGTVELNTAALSSGMYNYSLVVDGSVLETRKLTVVR